jgi:TonB family protein
MKTLLLIFLTAVFAAGALAQQSKLDQAIELYRLDKLDSALAIFQNEDQKNAAVRNYMGLIYFGKGDFKKARVNLEKAVQIEPGNITFRSNLVSVYLLNNEKKKARAETNRILAADPQSTVGLFLRGRVRLAENDLDDALEDANLAIKAEPRNAQAHTLKSDALLQKYFRSITKGDDYRKEAGLLRQAAEILDSCLKACGESDEIPIQKRRLDILAALIETAERKPFNPDDPVEPPPPGITRVKIITKPRAEYTDRARQEGIIGSVRLFILLAADGTIPYIAVVKGLGGGLSEQAVKAAQKIQFEPKKKDGQSVNAAVFIEYHFSIY